MTDYNLIAIGGGSAGLVTTYIGAAVKAKVALIERHKMGGDCLNTGCVPSKALIKSSRIVANIKNHKKYGISAAHCEIDFEKVMNRVKEVIKKIEPHDSVERYTSLGVDCITGEAKIIDRHTVEVNGKRLTTKNLILALGADPFVPPLPGLNDVSWVTSDTIWNLNTLPKKFLVLGGGPIGCELAQAFSRLGSKVTILEKLPQILPREDKDVAKAMEHAFLSEGINIKIGVGAKEAKKIGSRQFILCDDNSEIDFDVLLVAVGRRARTHGIDWKSLGIELNQNGTIKVDRYLRANGSNIYACGDVVGPYQFTHVASHQAWYASVNALFSPFKKFKADYRVIPRVTYTEPEVGSVGMSEQEAEKSSIPYTVTKYNIDDLDRAIAESEEEGFIKVITKAGKDEILGVTIVAHNAGEILSEYTLAMKHNIGLKGIMATIHPYPTMSESNKYVAGVWTKNHAPQFLLKMVAIYHSIRRNFF